MVCLIVGDANADLCATLGCFPAEGDDAPMTSLGIYSGGTAANVAVAFARLGGQARLLARIGQDAFAGVALRAAEEAGVDLAFVQRDAHCTTGLCLVAISPNGERTFFSHRGANVALEKPATDEIFANVHWLHISGHALLDGPQHETALSLLGEAKRRHIPTSLDLCLPLVRTRARDIVDLLSGLSVLFANNREVEALGRALGLSPQTTSLFEHTLSMLTQAGAGLVVAKMGASGSRIARGLSRIDIPPFSIEALDTTGAGDGFVAAFILMLQHSDSPQMAAEVANVVGALVASRRGAADACPSREEVASALASRKLTKTLDVFTQWTQTRTL